MRSETTRVAVSSLPAHLSFRIRFPGSDYREADVKLAADPADSARQKSARANRHGSTSKLPSIANAAAPVMTTRNWMVGLVRDK